MDALVVYYSLYGNTRRVAEQVAEALAQQGSVRTLAVDQLTAADCQGAELVVMGSPTHAQNLPKPFRSVLDGLRRGMLEGKSVAAFDTSLKMWGPLMKMTAAHKLLRRLKKLGGTPVAKGETFLVKAEQVEEGTESDLLYEGELERAGPWAAGLLGR